MRRSGLVELLNVVRCTSLHSDGSFLVFFWDASTNHIISLPFDPVIIVQLYLIVKINDSKRHEDSPLFGFFKVFASRHFRSFHSIQFDGLSFTIHSI